PGSGQQSSASHFLLLVRHAPARCRSVPILERCVVGVVVQPAPPADASRRGQPRWFKRKGSGAAVTPSRVTGIGAATAMNNQPWWKRHHIVGAAIILALFASAILPLSILAAPTTSASDGPGALAHFDLARKDCLGTAQNTTSKVWFTIANGVLSDVYYPTNDNTNVESMQYIV